MFTNSLKVCALLVLASPVLFMGCSTAESTTKAAKTTAISWQFDTIVDSRFVAKNIAVPMPANVMLIDARPRKPKYIKGHIPGAVSIPFSEFENKKDLLPKDKTALLIYYCGGVKCKLSHKSAKAAQKLGYSNVAVYSLGYPDWLKQQGNYKAITVEHVAKQLAENKVVIIDARPFKAKFVKGSIPTALSIPFSQWKELQGKLPRDLKTALVFIVAV